MTLEKSPGDSWMRSALSAPCFGQFQLGARQESSIRWTVPTCSCTGVGFRMQTGRREMTESISVTVSDPWKCQEDLREKLIPGRMKALGKSHSLDFYSWSRYVVSDTWLGSHANIGTVDMEILCVRLVFPGKGQGASGNSELAVVTWEMSTQEYHGPICW